MPLLHRTLAALACAALAAALPARAKSDAAAANVSQFITSSRKRPPAKPAWSGPSADLRASPIASFAIPECGADNARAIANLLAFLKTRPAQEYAVAVVPGSSEAACHHCAWTRQPDPHWVEPNFRSRLRHAFILLDAGIVHTLVISGGPIDPSHAEYDEAVFGLRELVSEYGGRFAGGNGDRLQDRVIVDPWAIHSEVNVRNGDRITRLLGLDRSLIVTEVGSIKRQGWYFVNHGAPLAFDHRAKQMFGYALGELEETGGAPALLHYLPKDQTDQAGTHPAQYTNSAGSRRDILFIKDGVDTAAIAHWGLRSLGELMQGGAHWDVGEAEAESKGYAQLVPDRAAVARSCSALQRR